MAHVFLPAQLLAVVFVADARVETRDFISEMGRGYFLNEPEAALAGGVLLQVKPARMDALPLYVILMAVRAGVPRLLVRHSWWMPVPPALRWLLESASGSTCRLRRKACDSSTRWPGSSWSFPAADPPARGRPAWQVLAGMTGVALMAAWLDMLRRPRNPLDPAAADAEAGRLPQGTQRKGTLQPQAQPS